MLQHYKAFSYSDVGHVGHFPIIMCPLYIIYDVPCMNVHFNHVNLNFGIFNILSRYVKTLYHSLLLVSYHIHVAHLTTRPRRSRYQLVLLGQQAMIKKGLQYPNHSNSEPTILKLFMVDMQVHRRQGRSQMDRREDS